MISSIASGAFTGLEDLNKLYVNNVHSHHWHDAISLLAFRAMSYNEVAAIAIGTFAELGSLTELCVTMCCHIIGVMYLMTCAGLYPPTSSYP
jgi:hypothetical protein